MPTPTTRTRAGYRPLGAGRLRTRSARRVNQYRVFIEISPAEAKLSSSAATEDQPELTNRCCGDRASEGTFRRGNDFSSRASTFTPVTLSASTSRRKLQHSSGDGE